MNIIYRSIELFYRSIQKCNKFKIQILNSILIFFQNPKTELNYYIHIFIFDMIYIIIFVKKMVTPIVNVLANFQFFNEK